MGTLNASKLTLETCNIKVSDTNKAKKGPMELGKPGIVKEFVKLLQSTFTFFKKKGGGIVLCGSEFFPCCSCLRESNQIFTSFSRVIATNFLRFLRSGLASRGRILVAWTLIYTDEQTETLQRQKVDHKNLIFKRSCKSNWARNSFYQINFISPTYLTPIHPSHSSHYYYFLCFYSVCLCTCSYG